MRMHVRTHTKNVRTHAYARAYVQYARAYAHEKRAYARAYACVRTRYFPVEPLFAVKFRNQETRFSLFKKMSCKL